MNSEAIKAIAVEFFVDLLGDYMPHCVITAEEDCDGPMREIVFGAYLSICKVRLAHCGIRRDLQLFDRTVEDSYFSEMQRLRDAVSVTIGNFAIDPEEISVLAESFQDSANSVKKQRTDLYTLYTEIYPVRHRLYMTDMGLGQNSIGKDLYYFMAIRLIRQLKWTKLDIFSPEKNEVVEDISAALLRVSRVCGRKSNRIIKYYGA